MPELLAVTLYQRHGDNPHDTACYHARDKLTHLPTPFNFY